MHRLYHGLPTVQGCISVKHRYVLLVHRAGAYGGLMIDGRGQVRITDFGLARLAQQVTGADARSGTPAYMAPEQLAGKWTCSGVDR